MRTEATVNDQSWGANYPRLVKMNDGHTVLLACGDNPDTPEIHFIGTVVHSTNPPVWKVGFHGHTWLKAGFEPFKGKVTLIGDD